MGMALLSGCAQYQWQKNGATQADLNRDTYDCQKEAAQAYPAKLVREQTRAAYVTPSTTNCTTSESSHGNRGHNHANSTTSCTTTPGKYVPPHFTTVDINANNRAAMAKQCMHARGWDLVKVDK
ncbi:MAG: hypothetical protein C4516_04900 [Oxalobacter sp.]|nr:MAG: hypothetical protein C4516_04900 [Oxalobacter sp.]